MTNAETEPLRALLERAAADPELRARIAADPAGALHAEGVEVNPDLPIQVVQLPATRSEESWLPVTADGQQLLVLAAAAPASPAADPEAELSDDHLAEVNGGLQWGEIEYNVFSWLMGPPSADDLAQADRDYQRWLNNPARLKRIGH